MSKRPAVNYRPHLVKYLQTQSGKMDRLAPKVFSEPSGETVHKLRISTRRVRTTLWLLKHSSAHLGFRNLEHYLHCLGEALGGVRELDVAISDAHHYSIETARLMDQRRRKKITLRRLLRRAQRSKLQAQLTELEGVVRSEDVITLKSVSRRLHFRLKAQLKNNSRGQIKVHRLRILMKKTQYVLEAMGRTLKPIRRLQGLLGDAHDLAFLQAVTGKDACLKK